MISHDRHVIEMDFQLVNQRTDGAQKAFNYSQYVSKLQVISQSSPFDLKGPNRHEKLKKSNDKELEKRNNKLHCG